MFSVTIRFHVLLVVVYLVFIKLMFTVLVFWQKNEKMQGKIDSLIQKFDNEIGEIQVQTFHCKVPEIVCKILTWGLSTNLLLITIFRICP